MRERERKASRVSPKYLHATAVVYSLMAPLPRSGLVCLQISVRIVRTARGTSSSQVSPSFSLKAIYELHVVRKPILDDTLNGCGQYARMGKAGSKVNKRFEYISMKRLIAMFILYFMCVKPHGEPNMDHGNIIVY